MTNIETFSRQPRFAPGAKVRVRSGVASPDFADIPLGGWTGTVEETGDSEVPIHYKIEWDQRTLDAMHPVYLKRCARDDLEPEFVWLAESDVEPDDGTVVPIAQPTEIQTPPLSESDQDDRVRKVFGLTHDDPLPEICHETLLAYYVYLTTHLKFPFTTTYSVDSEEVGPFAHKRITMKVTGLLDPEGENLDLEDGLICTCDDRGEAIEIPLANIEVKRKSPNFKLISDYENWFVSGPRSYEDDVDPDAEFEAFGADVPPLTVSFFIKWGLVGLVIVSLLGAAIGAGLRTLNGAGLAAMLWGIPLGMLGALVSGLFGKIAGTVGRFRYGAHFGVFLGSFVGGLSGVIAGVAAVALPWSLVGLVAGILWGRHLSARPRRLLALLRTGSYALLGSCCGILVSAFKHDQARATAGAVSGILIGLAVVAGLILLRIMIGLIKSRPTGVDEPEKAVWELEAPDHTRGQT
ncbi:Calcium binding [Singulisphaera sp. GP187]|uniref:calcium-binding protein n=1 Tax=Singulisphaera sp. GP187 TaxID=1882752 RepID=UPI000929CA85|nr:calcium-binding protein [Singulisphaera sp. GP187]SIO61089.1 Calcium binding [Singulisphaera sp. GP187]